MEDGHRLVVVEMPQWDDEQSQQGLRRWIADQGCKVLDVRLVPPFYHVVTEPVESDPL